MSEAKKPIKARLNADGSITILEAYTPALHDKVFVNALGGIEIHTTPCVPHQISPPPIAK